MTELPKHQKDWLQNIRPSPIKRSPAETVMDLPCNMTPYEIINRIYDGRLKPTQDLFNIFIAKAKKENEGAMKNHLRKQTAILFKEYLT